MLHVTPCVASKTSFHVEENAFYTVKLYKTKNMLGSKKCDKVTAEIIFIICLPNHVS
jgi:hypothetical protein